MPTGEQEEWMKQIPTIFKEEYKKVKYIYQVFADCELIGVFTTLEKAKACMAEQLIRQKPRVKELDNGNEFYEYQSEEHFIERVVLDSWSPRK